uniref:Eukaryotic translation initiation factor 3 subunit D n=1 Tax=Haptolina ericina TaxID=156174 RepID=A0A7S3AMK6_9EUKA
MTMDVPEARDVHSCGTVNHYEKATDRVNAKSEKALERIEGRAFFKVSTSDDPVVARLHDDPKLSNVRVFATDAILAVLMAAGRSTYSWDIVVNRVGNKLFLDKRPDSSIDYVTCNETAHDVGDEDKESINHPVKLMSEATFINQNFSQQVLSKTEPPLKFEDPASPFQDGAADEVPAPVGYKYRIFTLGKAPKEGETDTRLEMLCRTELDAVMKGKQDETLLMRLYALNETDSKLSGGIDWRQKLESQRGAVLATELKNNSNKLAKWTVQAMLAGADLIKLGYVSRTNVRDCFHHVILGTQQYKPKEFAQHINLNMNNAWGMLKAIIDLCLQLEEGKFLLLKDPNKPVIRFYSIPQDAFEEDPNAMMAEDDEEEEEEYEEEKKKTINGKTAIKSSPNARPKPKKKKAAGGGGTPKKKGGASTPKKAGGGGKAGGASKLKKKK